ncbi:hypothetical protein DSO57_1034528 [Entomophthora muscae]|uniref:Uncharacterized protein n=1 Tax=Entomophthora muscae TaxID=34485 RepID=A0ACC2RQT0_9FUNG|nr:hypothetical protein DSO57_1034528 [Entomophthora muscae]
MSSSKCIQQENVHNSESTSEGEPPLIPGSSTLYPEEDVAYNDQFYVPLEDPIDVSATSSYKSLPAEEDGCEIQASERPSSSVMVTTQFLINIDSDARLHEIQRYEETSASDSQLPTLEPSKAEETTSEKNLLELNRLIHQESKSQGASLNPKFEEETVGILQDSIPKTVHEETSKQITIDVFSTKELLNNSVPEKTAGENSLNSEASLELSSKVTPDEALITNESLTPRIIESVVVDKSGEVFLSEDPINASPAEMHHGEIFATEEKILQ